MEQITMQDAELVGGSGLVGWVLRQMAMPVLDYLGGLITSGQVDYTGVAEEQGHYYNMVGA